jgi:DNA-binding NarL/FixJ family response regulator
MNNSSLKVVAVSDDTLRSELLDVLLTDESDCYGVVVESLEHAYSRIRQLEPDLVLVFMEISDPNACQLLTMLETDGRLRRIPVVTCATKPERAAANLAQVIAHQAGRSALRQLVQV